MTNWKTTLSGYFLAVLNLMANGVTLKQATFSAGIITFGHLAADGKGAPPPAAPAT